MAGRAPRRAGSRQAPGSATSRSINLPAIAEARRRLLVGIVVVAYGSLMAALAFWLYCGFRTLGSNFGFHWKSTLVSGALTALFMFLPQLTAALSVRNSPHVVGRNMKAIWLASAVAWLLGCGVSEALIIADERRFEAEVQERGNVSFSRPRSWPNGDAGLVYNAGKFHATD
jgi:hypothetical protein